MIDVIMKHLGTIMMLIEGLTIICMIAVGWKVYKIDNFKNKYIFFLIFFINLSLWIDFIDWIFLICGV